MAYPHVVIEMYAKGYTIKDLANILNMSEDMLHEKLFGYASFNETEKDKISLMFSYMDETYLFEEK